MIKICTDSCCDLNKDQIEANDIAMIPLYVTLGETDYLDGETVQPQDIFNYVKETGVLPKTAARSAVDVKEFFEKQLESVDQLIYIGISSQLSSAYENTCRAAEEIGNDKVIVIDSQSLSTGIGLLCLYAAELARQGLPAQEIVSIITKQAKKTQASFIVDKLDYLYKGGRCSAISRFGASLLKIKPRLELKNGKIENAAKYIGKFDIVVKKYVDDIIQTYPNVKRDLCFITHTCKDKALVDEIVSYVESKKMFNKVVSSVAGSTISCHCGENTLGILYLLDD